MDEIYLFLANLQIVPQDVDQFYYVRIIDISHNKISKLPNEICNLNLLKLWIDGNTIKKLPKELVNLKKLKSLICGQYFPYTNIMYSESQKIIKYYVEHHPEIFI